MWLGHTCELVLIRRASSPALTHVVVDTRTNTIYFSFAPHVVPGTAQSLIQACADLSEDKDLKARTPQHPDVITS
jgi:hypothetical protein